MIRSEIRIANLMTRFIEKDLKAVFRKEVLEPLREETEALINTVPLELGLVNSLAGLNEYEANVAIVGMELSIMPRPNSIAEAMEEGQPPWNIGVALLNSPKAHDGEHGTRYIDVPLNSSKLRHPTSGGNALGQVARPPLTLDERRRVVRESTHQAIGGRDDRRARVEEMRREVIGDVRREVTMKLGRKDARSTRYQDRVVKIRRVSYKSIREGKWWHPGFSPTPVLATIQKEINLRLDQIVEAWF